MKFKEQFPSFHWCKGNYKLIVLPEDIQEHCLDKQKVKDAIMKYRKYSPTIIDDLLEELGLGK